MSLLTQPQVQKYHSYTQAVVSGNMKKDKAADLSTKPVLFGILAKSKTNMAGGGYMTGTGRILLLLHDN